MKCFTLLILTNADIQIIMDALDFQIQNGTSTPDHLGSFSYPDTCDNNKSNEESSKAIEEYYRALIDRIKLQINPES